MCAARDSAHAREPSLPSKTRPAVATELLGRQHTAVLPSGAPVVCSDHEYWRMTSWYKSAESLKLDGNTAFKEGKYGKAISAYTQAIAKSNGTVPNYFTNRALSRLRSEPDSDALELVISDCVRAIELSESQNATYMKAYYYKGQAELMLERCSEAYSSLVKAYRAAIREKNASVTEIHGKVMEARKQRWMRSEQKRIADESALSIRLTSLIEADRQWNLQVAGDDQERVVAANAQAEETIFSLQDLLRRSDERFRIREVPDYFICPISLGVFIDPVITPSGRSYERTSILQHLQHNPFDPLTREPLIASKIFDNLSLRHACDDFLKQNGWAIDY